MDAQRVVAAVIAGRKKFGKMYGLGEFSADDILDALVELNEQGELDAGASHEEVVKLKRQLTASKAREAKLKKEKQQLQDGLDACHQVRKEREAEIQSLATRLEDALEL